MLSRAGAASFDADAYTCFLSDELRPGAGFSGAPQMKLSELQAVIGLGGAGGGMGGLGGAGECPTLGNVLPSDNGCTVFWEYRPRLSVVGYCCYSFGRWGCR